MFHILSQNHLIDPAGVKWSPLGWDMTGQDTWFHLHWNLYKEVILQQGNENADRKEKGSQEAKNECYSNTLQQRKKEQGIRDQTTMRDATSPQMPFMLGWAAVSVQLEGTPFIWDSEELLSFSLHRSEPSTEQSVCSVEPSLAFTLQRRVLGCRQSGRNQLHNGSSSSKPFLSRWRQLGSLLLNYSEGKML